MFSDKKCWFPLTVCHLAMSRKYSPKALLHYQKRHCPMYTHRSFLNLYSMRQLCQNGHTRVSVLGLAGMKLTLSTAAYRVLCSHLWLTVLAIHLYFAHCWSVLTHYQGLLFFSFWPCPHPPKMIQGVSKKMEEVQWDSWPESKQGHMLSCSAKEKA